MDRMLALGGPAASFFLGAVDPDGTEVIDDHTVNIPPDTTLCAVHERSDHFTHCKLGNWSWRIFSRVISASSGTMVANSCAIMLAGSGGPYRLTEFDSSDRVIIEAVPDYSLGYTKSETPPHECRFS